MMPVAILKGIIMHYAGLLLACCCCICLGLRASGQAPGYIHFGTRDGMTSDNIYAITQDQDGFIWIGTETGVSRFDGSHFRNFTAEDGLPGNEITAVYADSRNRVWIFPFKKAICYYYHGRIYNAANSPMIRKIPVLSEQKAIAEDIAGRVLIQTVQHSVVLYPGDSCTITANDPPHKGFFRPVTSIGVFQNNTLAPDVIPAGLGAGANQSCIGQSAHAQRYTCWRHNNTILAYAGNRLISRMPQPPHTLTTYSFNDSLFIFNTLDGTHIYELATGRRLRILLPEQATNFSYIDRDGGTWISSAGSGLYYIPPGKHISVTRTTENRPLFIHNFYCYGDKLLGSTGGDVFHLIDKRTHRIERSLRSRDIHSAALVLPEGNSWKAMTDPLLKIYGTPFHSTVRERLSKMIVVQDDTMLAALFDRILEIRLSTMTVRKVWERRSTCAFKKGNTYYAGTMDGLYRFPASDTFPHNEHNSGKVLENPVVAIAQSHKGRYLWILTQDNGVYCLENDGRIRNYNEAGGLSGNIGKCLYTDGKRIFAGTSNGLNIIDPDHHFAISSYYTVDGLISNDINCVYAEGNEVWAGTSGGYSILYPDSMQPPERCRLKLTDLVVSGRSLSVDTVGLSLPPGDNNIEFRYAGISFRSMGRVKYTYRLRGLHDGWRASEENKTSYPALPAGNYTFELFATDRYGLRSRLLAVPFVIRQHWWEHGWVQLSGLLLALCLLLLALHVRSRRIRGREQEREQLRARISELEQITLRAQMNPHFIFNSLNSFYQYVINRDLAGASRFMNDFSTLIRLLFEITTLKDLPLDKELFFLTTYMNLEQTKLNNAFAFTIQVSEELVQEDIRIPTFIIQPFVENSIRHGIAHLKDKTGSIVLAVATSGDRMIVTIDDNGPGRAYTEASKLKLVSIHKSSGIAHTAERIALYNKTQRTNITFEIVDKHDASGRPSGTLVRISFPLNDITW